MKTFKEYLIMENDGGFKAFEAEVYKEMQARGMDDPEWGIVLQAMVRDAYENGADIEDVIMSLNYNGEEEMEQKMPAMDDANRHFANQFDREVIQKRNKEDVARSAVSTKRYNQRQSRDERRYRGK